MSGWGGVPGPEAMLSVLGLPGCFPAGPCWPSRSSGSGAWWPRCPKGLLGGVAEQRLLLLEALPPLTALPLPSASARRRWWRSCSLQAASAPLGGAELRTGAGSVRCLGWLLGWRLRGGPAPAAV